MVRFVYSAALRVVALHGFTGSADSFAPLPGCLSLPLLGHAPRVPSAGATWDGEVARLVREVRAVEAPVHLVGYSMGARLALAVALVHPVARLTLVGVHPGLDTQAERAERAGADAKWVRVLRGKGIEAFVDAWEALPLWHSQRALSGAVREAQRRTRLAHDPGELAGALDATGLGRMPPLTSRLGSVICPVQLVAGGLDNKFLALARRMAPAFAQGTIHVVPGVGHNVCLEAPSALANLLAR